MMKRVREGKIPRDVKWQRWTGRNKTKKIKRTGLWKRKSRCEGLLSQRGVTLKAADFMEPADDIGKLGEKINK